MQIKIVSDAAIHLFRIYICKKKSVPAWCMLITKLGLLGCLSLLLGYLERQKRIQKIAKYLKNPHDP